MKIVRAGPEDASLFTEIALAAKRHWGYPERWIESWREILTIAPEFIAANVACSAVEGDHVLGFYVLTKEDDGLHLDHLWIRPAAIRRGIGRALFEHAIDQARNSGFATIKIEADPNAEGFYKRMGATRAGTRVSEIEGERRDLPLLEFRVRLPS